MRGRGWIAAAALMAAAAAVADEAAPPTPATPEAGRQVYKSFCERCHGLNLAVGSAAFFDLRTFPKDEKERFVTSVTNGKRQMPAWGNYLKPDQIDALWAYIGSVNGW